MKTCVVCDRKHLQADCVTFELTAAEEAALIKRGVQPPTEFTYCNRCWTLIKDPQLGPQLMRSTAERQMLKLGVEPSRAKKIADKFFTNLVELQRRRHHGTHS